MKPRSGCARTKKLCIPKHNFLKNRPLIPVLTSSRNSGATTDPIISGDQVRLQCGVTDTDTVPFIAAKLCHSNCNHYEDILTTF
jgi:hypothetical protein